MKKAIILAGFMAVLSCEKKNETIVETSREIKQETAKDSVHVKSLENINDIKTEFKVINDMLIAKKMDSSAFDYECDEVSGNVVYYMQNGELRSIKHFHGDSHFSSVENYYLKDGKLFFIFQEDTSWSFDGGTPEKPETKDNVEEKRLYYINDKISYCKNKKYTVRSKNQSRPENIQESESKNCDDTALKKNFEILLQNRDKKKNAGCIL